MGRTQKNKDGMGLQGTCRAQARPYTCTVGPGFTRPARQNTRERRRLGAISEREEGHLAQVLLDVYPGTSIPFGVLSKTSYLLASVFGQVSEEDIPDERQRISLTTQYQLRLMTSLQGRALKERDGFALFVARSEADSTAGVLTLSLGLSASGAKNHRLSVDDSDDSLDGRHGENGAGKIGKIFSLCNMAVKKECRRRGIATLMLERAEEHVAAGASEEDGAIVMVLSVDKYNEEARRLYEAIGYRVDESWEDPRWIQSVERGSVDVARRMLYWKRILIQ